MNTPDEIQSMVDARSYCVVGASRDPGKYGYQVYRAIKSEGKTVYPVNPNAEFIGNAVCYPSVKDLPEKVDVAVFVVPADVAREILPECHAMRIKNVWMQPGAESRAAIEYCEANSIPVVAGECIMIRFRTEIDDDM